jgi:hypothetical protein
MTVVIMILMALIGTGMGVTSSIKSYRLGREAGETLRSVHTAQRIYLSDNPTADVTSLTNTLLIPYLANGTSTMPTVKSLTGTTLTIKVTVFPPVINNGSGGTYDPSGVGDDSLWDVGKQ